MVLRTLALVEVDPDPDPDDDRISAALGPYFCRCGCYPCLRRAMHRAAVLRRDDGRGHGGSGVGGTATMPEQ